MSANKKKQYDRIAFTIPIPGGNLPIIRSANAWWMDESKLKALELAFKIDATIPEACAYAGITLRQYKYFTSIHPEYNEIKELYRSHMSLKARMNIAKALESSNEKLRVKTSIWYLEKHDPDLAKPKRKKSNGLLRWEERRQQMRELDAKLAQNDSELLENIRRIKRGLEPIYKNPPPPIEKLNPEDVKWDDEPVDNIRYERNLKGDLMPVLPELEKPEDKKPRTINGIEYYDPEEEE